MSRDFASANPPEEEPRMRECPSCHGSQTCTWVSGKGGRLGVCPTCHGTGEVPREEAEPQFDTEEERDGER